MTFIHQNQYTKHFQYQQWILMSLQPMPLLPSAIGNHWLTSDVMDWFIVYISGKFCAWLLPLSTRILKPVHILSVSVVPVFYFCFSLLSSIPF